MYITDKIRNMKQLTFLLLLLSFGLTAQITVNTNFLPNIAAPLDVRQKIATLADTTTVTFPYIGALCYVTSKDSVYYKGANGWKPIGKRGNYTGTVTNFSAGDLSPLFTTSEATTTTTPALTFSQVSQTQNKVFASPDGSSGNPTFRAIAVNDVPTLNQNTTGSAATLTTPRTIGITGDLSYTSPSFDGSSNVTAAGTLATVNSNVGTFTNATITTNAKGLITAASSGASVTGESTTVSDSPTVDLTLTGYDISAKVDTSKIATQYDLTLVSVRDSTVVSAGTGISVSESPANTFTVTNTAPDQTVSITGAGITNITGTYPNFTATSTEVDGSTTNEKITALTWNNSQDSLQVVENGVIYRTKIDGFLSSEVDGSTTNELQTIAVTGTTTGITTLSNSGGSMTIAGAGINSVGVSGSTITITGTEVDGSIINEGALSVGTGGANSSSIQSNTLGSNTVTVAGGVGIGVSEVSNTITITNTVRDSTVISSGYGIDVMETPANTYTIEADTSKLATQYDLLVLGDITSVTVSSPITGGSTSGVANIGLDTTSSVGAATQYDLSLKQNLITGTYPRIPFFRTSSTFGNSDSLRWDTLNGALIVRDIPIGSNAYAQLYIGNGAASGATAAESSNFIGENAGNGATNASGCNFIGDSAGRDAVSVGSSNFIGSYSGYAATNADASNFFGENAGNGASNANSSNFFGVDSGRDAINASSSNFFGNNAGAYATNAYGSNFFGTSAGQGATRAAGSNFFGLSAGQNAIDASSSNFFGDNSGINADSAYYSNFFGIEAGGWAYNANRSNFFGEGAGLNATDAHDSNFFGNSAGEEAFYANRSNFFGELSGLSADSAYQSNFFGYHSGQSANNANNSNFLGYNSGYLATNANNSNFFGNAAGESATNAELSNFMGAGAGSVATNANNSNFFGASAGYAATNANNSNFLGNLSGTNATNAEFSNFIGKEAGYGATGASYSQFYGFRAGYNATGANTSTFMGNNSGSGATNASGSNFIGEQAGIDATDAYQSNFLGFESGTEATNANNSNFVGIQSGFGAANADNSNFFGPYSGNYAVNARYSNLFGSYTGALADSARYCNLFGYRVGLNDGFSSIDSNNIIIGTNISLPKATANSINIGGVLFGTGTHGTLTGAPKKIAHSGGKIGIMTVTPTQELHVTGNTRITGAIYDSNNDPGTSGQVLSSTVTGTDWITSGGSGTVTSITATGPLTGGTITTSGSIGLDTTSATGAATQYDLTTVTGTTNLSITGSSSPLTLNSSTGTDVTITAGTGITLAGTSGNVTITNSSADQSITNEGQLSVGAGTAGTSIINSNTSGSGAITFQEGAGIDISESGDTITIDNIGMTSLNGSTNGSQTFATGTASTDFNIATSGFTHTFNLPDASASSRGALTSADWSTFNGKFSLPALTSGSVLFSNGTTISQDNSNFFWNNTNKRLGIRVAAPAHSLDVMGSSTSTEFIGSFKANGVTLETPTTGTKGNMLSLQGAGAAYYHGRDVTNDIDFLMGTSSSGMAFMGSMSNHGLDLRTNNTARIAITNAGVVTIGNLAGSGTRMVTATSTGQLGTATITTGTVTSVGITNGGGISVSGSPITTSGSITLTATDASITNEGYTGVVASGAIGFNDAKLQGYNSSGTATGNGTTFEGGTGITITETTSTNGGTIKFDLGTVYGSLAQGSSALTLTTTLTKLIDMQADVSSSGITLSAANDRMTVANTGVYEVNFSCDCKGNGSTFDIEHMGYKNGTTFLGLNTRLTATNGVMNNMSSTKMVSLTAGDYIEMWSKGSTTGGSVDCLNVYFSIKRL